MKNCFSDVLHYGRVVDTFEINFCRFNDENFGRFVQSEYLVTLDSVHAMFTPYEMRVVYAEKANDEGRC